MTAVIKRADIAAHVSEELKLSKAQGRAAVDLVFGRIGAAMRDGHEVRIEHFGVFRAPMQEAREARDPRDPGRTVAVPAQRLPKYKASSGLRSLVNSQE